MSYSELESGYQGLRLQNQLGQDGTYVSSFQQTFFLFSFYGNEHLVWKRFDCTEFMWEFSSDVQTREKQQVNVVVWKGISSYLIICLRMEEKFFKCFVSKRSSFIRNVLPSRDFLHSAIFFRTHAYLPQQKIQIQIQRFDQ